MTPSAPNGHLSRRDWLRGLIGTAAWAVMGIHRPTSAADRTLPRVAEETFAFIRRCARRDGGYAPSPDPKYPGNSDTGSSDLAAVTYAATLAKTMGWRLPHPERSIEFIQRHQQADGSFINLEGKMNPKSDLAVLKEPDWDVHACFDAVFILRQLGGESEPVRKAIRKAADWALSCRNEDGGFGHYPGWHSDMDAVYFQFGTLIQAGRMPMAKRDLPDAHTMSWGHAMRPGRLYTET